MVRFMNGATDYHYPSDEYYAPWEGRWNSSTFDPAHLWLSLPAFSPGQQQQRPTRDLRQYPRSGGKESHGRHGTSWPERAVANTNKNLFDRRRYGIEDDIGVPPLGRPLCLAGGDAVGGVRWLSGASYYYSVSLPPMVSASVAHDEGEMPFGTRPVPPKRCKKQQRRRVERGIKALQYHDPIKSKAGILAEGIKDAPGGHSWSSSVSSSVYSDGGLKQAGGNDPGAIANQRFVKDDNGYCIDQVRVVGTCGRRGDTAVLSEAGASSDGVGEGNCGECGSGVGGGGGGGDGGVARGGGGTVVAAATVKAAGVSGCVQVPSSGGTRGPRRRPPPPPPPFPPHPPPPSSPLPPSSRSPSPPPPSSSSGQHHPSPLWRFLTCWVVRGKMAEWDVDLSSPTYCAACAVMDTRAEECCSSAWETAEAWWGSFVCPSWKCGGCVAEVIKETPKPSFTLPKPPVGPFPKFKIELTLDICKLRTTSATSHSTAASPPPPPPCPSSTFSTSSSKHTFNPHPPTLSVPQSEPTPNATPPPYYVGEPTRGNYSRSSKSFFFCMPPPERGSSDRDPQMSFRVPKASLVSLDRLRHRLRRLPSRLLTNRLKTDLKTDDLYYSTSFSSSFKTKGLPPPPPPPLTSGRCPRTYRRYLPYSRLKTRLQKLRTFVTDQLYR